MSQVRSAGAAERIHMLLTRFGCAAAVSAALALSAVAPVLAQEASTAEQTIDVMNTLFGKHPGARANHAKGLVAEGSFTPSPEAAKISKASLFQGPAVPVTVRFSDATGIPTIPDGAANANPHGLSLKFKLGDGSEMDVVTNALKYFPVATGEEFRDLLKAVAASGPDAGAPDRAGALRQRPPGRRHRGRDRQRLRRASPGRPTTASTPSSSSTRTASVSRSASASSRCRARRSCPPRRRPSATRTS